MLSAEMMRRETRVERARWEDITRKTMNRTSRDSIPDPSAEGPCKSRYVSMLRLHQFYAFVCTCAASEQDGRGVQHWENRSREQGSLRINVQPLEKSGSREDQYSVLENRKSTMAEVAIVGSFMAIGLKEEGAMNSGK
jgi:hypothetical protein